MINLINTEEFADIIKEKGWCSGATNEQYAKLFKMVEQNASYERIALAVWFCTPEESEDNIKDEIIARFWDRGRKHDENLKEVYVYTHPYCHQLGRTYIPRDMDVDDSIEYLKTREEWSQILFEEPDIEVNGTDFEVEEVDA